jgi:heme exporter protein CcmD
MTLGTAWGMGRYGGYVWTCYGITLLALIFLAVVVRRRWQSELKLATRRAGAAARLSGEPTSL